MDIYRPRGALIGALFVAGAVLSGCATPPSRPDLATAVLERSDTIQMQSATPRTGWFRRSASEDPDGIERFGTVRRSFVQITSHPDSAVAGRINRALAETAEPGVRLVRRTDGAVMPEFSDENPADLEITQRVVLDSPEILSVVTGKSYRPIDAAQRTETTEVWHFDLKTGRLVRWKELVRPADWPALRTAATSLFADDVDVLLKAEFAELTELPEGYVADGTLWLLVRPEAGSSAGETERFYPVQVALVRGLLNPALLARFGAAATPVPPPFWAMQRTPKANGTEEIVFVFSSDERGEAEPDTKRFVPKLDAGEPELLEWTANVELNLGLLHYFAGWVGTLDKYAVTRVAVIDLTTDKLLGCPPRSYTPINGAPPVTQPVYRVEAGRLVVEDVEWGGRESFGVPLLP